MLSSLMLSTKYRKVASAAVRSKAMVQLGFFYSLFVVAPIVCEGLVLGLCFVLQ